MTAFLQRVLSRLALVAAVLAGPAAVSAAPYTAYFSGHIASYTDGQSNPDPSMIGQAFSGWLTYDTTFVQETFLGFGPYGPYVLGMSQGGCSQIVDGVCNEIRPRSPIVTAYQIETQFFAPLTPVPMEERYSDSSSRTNSRMLPSPMAPTGNDNFSASRQQSTNQISSIDTITTFLEAMRTISLGISSDDNTLLTSVFDLGAPINLFASGLLAELRFTNRLQEQICQATPLGSMCTPWIVSPQSFSFVGTLSDLRISEGSIAVPEPDGNALVLLALVLAMATLSTKSFTLGRIMGRSQKRL